MGKDIMAKNAKIELVSITVKIDGKIKVFKRKELAFHGWETDCDCCGGLGGVNMTIYDGKKVHYTKVESY